MSQLNIAFDRFSSIGTVIRGATRILLRGGGA